MNQFFEALGQDWVDAAQRRGAEISKPALDSRVALELLELARVAAHTQERRFAPLTSYLAGVAAERLRAAKPGLDDAAVAEFIPEVRQKLEREGPGPWGPLPDVDHRELAEALHRHPGGKRRRHLAEGLSAGSVGARHDDRRARVRLLTYRSLEGNRAQVGYAEPLGRALGPPVVEDEVLLAATVADQPAHVLDETERWHVQPAKHLQRLERDLERRLLRRAHDRDAGQRNRLGQGQRRVAGAGWKVDHQIVELTPQHIAQHLLDRPRHQRPAPHHRLVGPSQQSDRDDLHAEGVEWHQLLVLDSRLLANAEHAGHRRAVDVCVEQPNARPRQLERGREVHGDRGLAHAALPRAHRDHVLDTGDRRLMRAAIEGRADVGGHLQVDGRYAGKVGDELTREGLESIAYRTGRGRQLECEADLPRIGDRDVFDHAEAHHVAAEVGVLDRGQRGEDVLPTGH